MGDDLNDLINQLKRLQVQETRLIERIEALTIARGQRQSLGIDTIQVGDRVRFDRTKLTGAGTGLVIGFTGGEDPFVLIRRDGGHEIKRKPHTLHRINE